MLLLLPEYLYNRTMSLTLIIPDEYLTLGNIIIITITTFPRSENV